MLYFHDTGIFSWQKYPDFEVFLFHMKKESAQQKTQHLILTLSNKLEVWTFNPTKGGYIFFSLSYFPSLWSILTGQKVWIYYLWYQLGPINVYNEKKKPNYFSGN